MFPCESFKIRKNICFEKHLRTAATVGIKSYCSMILVGFPNILIYLPFSALIMDFLMFKTSLQKNRVSLIPRTSCGDLSTPIFSSFLQAIKDIRQFIKFNFTNMFAQPKLKSSRR